MPLTRDISGFFVISPSLIPKFLFFSMLICLKKICSGLVEQQLCALRMPAYSQIAARSVGPRQRLLPMRLVASMV